MPKAVPKTQTGDIWQPFHAVQGRHPGWGGINLADDERFILCWEAHDALNWTNRKGVASDNVGVLATRPGYADGPKYGHISGSSDSATTYGPVRMLHKFYPGAATVKDGTEVDFDGSGLNDLTVNAAASSGSTYFLTISKGLPTVVFSGLGEDDLTVDDETAIDGVYVIIINAGDPTDPNTFDWTKDGEGGAEGVAITGASQTLDAIDVTFGATTGHIAADMFTIKADEFDWTRDGVGGAEGVAITGGEQELGADGPTVTFAAITGHTEDDLFTISPPAYVKRSAQTLRLVQTEAGLNKSAFQKWNGSSWTTIQDGDSNDLNNLCNLFCPQCIVFDIPTPLFCWIDPVNGLITYDGTTATRQAIPKYTDSESDITGALWLEQIDGRLIVGGNILDTGEHRVVYYSAAGDPTKWTSDNGGGSLVIYGSDSRAGNANPKWVRGLATLLGSLVVFSDDSRHVITGIGSTVQQVEMFPGQGCWSGKCISKHDGVMYWWGKDGAYKWRGGPVADRISDKIWNKIQDVKLISSYKWFSFVYKDQLWTNVRYRNATPSGLGTQHGYHNFVYDIKTDSWFVFNIPMVAAFHSLGGLADIDRLYFASPIDTGTNEYKCYSYAWDEVDQENVYADKVTGAADSRTGTAITSTWETGKLHGGNPTAEIPNLAHVAKEFQKIIVELDVTDSDGLVDGGEFTTRKIEYRTDRTTSYADLDNFSVGTQAQVFQHLYPDYKKAHYIQYRFTVSATKRMVIYQVYHSFKDLGLSLTEG